jgi:hypothetical protein
MGLIRPMALAQLAWSNGQSGLAGPCLEHGARRHGGTRAADAVVVVRWWGSQVEHRWRRVGTPGNTSSKGRVRVGGAMVRWQNEQYFLLGTLNLNETWTKGYCLHLVFNPNHGEEFEIYTRNLITWI